MATQLAACIGECHPVLAVATPCKPAAQAMQVAALGQDVEIQPQWRAAIFIQNKQNFEMEVPSGGWPCCSWWGIGPIPNRAIVSQPGCHPKKMMQKTNLCPTTSAMQTCFKIAYTKIRVVASNVPYIFPSFPCLVSMLPLNPTQ